MFLTCDLQLIIIVKHSQKLLQKAGEQHTRQSSADSSGCSSGQESVTSSLTSDSQVSTDSGTEVDPVLVTPNKLLEAPPSWESSSLRQRIVSSSKPAGGAGERWDSYVKVSKSGDPMPVDAQSLVRSTPNLTDSPGFPNSQQTWTSTGYISMPSSEELSRNASPMQKDAVVSKPIGYSIVGTAPNKSQIKSDGGNSPMSALIPIKTEIKPSAPYITLAALNKDLEDLTFGDSPKLKVNPVTAAAFSISDKVSKPYVQTGMIDSLQKPPVAVTQTSPSDGGKADNFEKLRSMCAEKLMTTVPAASNVTTTKPYVTISSIADLGKPSSPMTTDEGVQKPLLPTTAAETPSKPYVLASSVFHLLRQQKDKTESPTVAEESTDPKSWDTKTTAEQCFKESELARLKDQQQTPMDISSSSYVQHRHFEKPHPTQTNSQTSADEQYSKVAVVPGPVK